MNAYKTTQPSSARGLASAILLQAITDYRAVQNGQIAECKDVNVDELQKFFTSGWFSELCEVCNIDKKIILRNLDKRTL